MSTAPSGSQILAALTNSCLLDQEASVSQQPLEAIEENIMWPDDTCIPHLLLKVLRYYKRKKKFQEVKSESPEARKVSRLLNG